MKIYQIDSSARKKGSTSRALAKKLLHKIKKPGDEVIYRDLDDEMLFVSGLTESGMKIDENYQTKEGDRFLQGCYIDYDSTEGKLRHLKRKFNL